MYQFPPPLVQIKYHSLKPQLIKDIKKQGFQVDTRKANWAFIVLGSAERSIELPLPKKVKRPQQVELFLYEQSTPVTHDEAVVHCAQNGAPLRPFWLYQNIPNPKGQDAAFSALKPIRTVYYQSAARHARVTETCWELNGRIVEVFVKDLWEGMVKIRRWICPICRHSAPHCQKWKGCDKYGSHLIPAQVQLPHKIRKLHDTMLTAVQKTSGIIYPLHVNWIKKLKPALIPLSA